MEFDEKTVSLYCPQTLDFDSQMAGTLERKGGIDKDEFEKFTAFENWKKTMVENLQRQNDEEHMYHDHPYSLRSIHINAVTRFPNGKVGFVKMDAWIERDEVKPEKESKSPKKLKKAKLNAKSLFETVFLRGGSVAMLMILRPTDSRNERWVVLTEQPRVPACSLRFLEIPAGMLDAERNFAGAAAREIEEETGLKIPEGELIDMTKLALEDSRYESSAKRSDAERLMPAMYPSPGGCDEYISLFLWEKEMDRVQIEALKGKMEGLRTEGEMITLKIEKYDDLWRLGARDAKTLGAWALYEGLNSAGILQKEQKKRRGFEPGPKSPREGLRSSTNSIFKSLGQALR